MHSFEPKGAGGTAAYPYCFSSLVVLPDFKKTNEKKIDHAILRSQTYCTVKRSGRDAEDDSLVSPTDTENQAGKNDSGEKKDTAAEDAGADPNLVDWDGPKDPANLRNWSKKRKMLNTSLVSLSVLYSYVFRITPFLNLCLCVESIHQLVNIYLSII